MKPGDIHKLFTQYQIEKNLDALVELYDEEAIFVTEAGEEMHGPEQIREALKPFLEVKMQGTGRTMHITGDTAFVRLDWNVIEGESSRPAMALEVLKKKPDGRWVYLIDSPFGGN